MMNDNELMKRMLEHQAKTIELAFHLCMGETDAFDKVFNKKTVDKPETDDTVN